MWSVDIFSLHFLKFYLGKNFSLKNAIFFELHLSLQRKQNEVNNTQNTFIDIISISCYKQIFRQTLHYIIVFMETYLHK